VNRIHSIRKAPVFWISILLCVPVSTLSEQKPIQFVQMAAGSEIVQTFHMLTQQAGWVCSTHRLFWTGDAGAHWSTITPTMKPEENISAVFFLDVNRGWVLLSYPRDDETEFEIASTSNGGGNWSTAHLDVPDPAPDVGLSADAWIEFADPMHGRVIVRMSTNTAVSWGVLVATQDGGNTWKPQSRPPAAGALSFVTPQEGWLASDTGDALYSTYDAGVHWHEVSMTAPSDVDVIYDLPKFRDSRHGLLSVLFDGPNSTTRTVFATSDGGRTWNAQGQVAQGRAAAAPDAMIDSMWIGVTVTPDHGLMVKTFAVDTKSNAGVSGNIGNLPIWTVRDISFATTLAGWVVVGPANCISTGGRGCTEVLSTADGGANWANITPAALKPREVLSER
jgi:photosystem II stability/assembly factor-like uncharacterized protein